MGAEIDRLEITIEAEANKASKALDVLIGRLDRIAASVGGIRTGNIGNIGQVAAGNKKSVSGLSAKLNGLVGSTNKATKATKSFSQTAGKFYANCFLAIRGVKKLGSAIEAAMDYSETFNYYNVTMDKIATEFSKDWEKFGYESADAYGKSFSSRLNELTRKMTGFKVGDFGELNMDKQIGLGLDPQAIMDYQASISAITNSVGLIGENSANASKALTMLAADMSSLKNVDLKTVMSNFQSGLIGQSRALYKYGIDITNANLQTYAYNLGLSKSVSEMSQAEKMQLRLVAILDQSKVAWGDMANTLGSVANQYRMMKQQIANVARTIGNIFLPIVQKILPYINGLLIALQRLLNFLGFKIHGGNWLKDTMDGISGGYSGAPIEDLGDEAENTADGLDKAAKAAKKLKTATLGIDELNILTPEEDEGSGSGDKTNSGGSIDLSDAIGDALAGYESIWDSLFADMENKAQEIADKIVGFFKKIWEAIEPFREAVMRLWNEGLSKLANFTWTALKDFYNEFLVPMGKWAFGTPGAGLTRLVDVINNGLMAIHWDELNRALKEFWIAIEPYAEQFGEGLIDFFEDIVGLGVDIINAFPGVLDRITAALERGEPETARKWGYAFGVLAVGIMALKGVGTVIAGLAGLGTTLKGLSEGLAVLFGSGGLLAKLGVVFSPIVTLFSNLGEVFALTAGGAGTFCEAFSAVFGISAPIAAVIAAITFALVDLWNTSEMFRASVGLAFLLVKDSVVSAFQKIGEAIAPLWDSIKELGRAFYEFYEESGLKWIVEKLASLWAIGVGIVGSAFFERIGSAVSGVSQVLSGFLEIITGIIDVFTGLLTLNPEKILSGLREIGSGIEEIFSGIGEYFFGWIGDVWNNITEKFTAPLEDMHQNVVEWWEESMLPALEKIPGFFQEILEQVKSFVKEKWEDIVTYLQGLPSRISEIIEQIAGWFGELPGKIVYALGFVIGRVAAWGVDLWFTFWRIVGELVSDIGKWFSEAPEKIIQAISSTAAKVGEWAQDLWSRLESWVNNIISDVRSWFAEMPGKIMEAISSTVAKLQEWKESLSEFVNEKIPEIIEEIVNIFLTLKDKLFDVGGQIIDGLWSGIKGAWEGLKSSIGDLCNNFVEGFKDGLDIHSPSRKLAEVGDYALAGLFEPFGLTGETTSKVNAFSNAFLSAISRAMAPEKFAEIGHRSISGFLTAWTDGLRQMEQTMNTFSGSMVSNSMMLGQKLASSIHAGWQSGVALIRQDFALLNQYILTSIQQIEQSLSKIFLNITNGIIAKWSEMNSRMNTQLLMMNNSISSKMKTMQDILERTMSQALLNWTNRWRRMAEIVTEHCRNIQTTLNNFYSTSLSRLDAFGQDFISKSNSVCNSVLSAYEGLAIRLSEIILKMSEDIAKAVGDMNDSVKESCDSMKDALNDVKGASSSINSRSVNVMSMQVSGYASGGHPETGELFMARENGITEMVGRMGSRPSVANNDQIVDGIKQGVYEAVVAAMSGMNKQGDEPIVVNTTVEMDGRAIVRQTDEVRRRMGWNFQPI